MMANRVVLVATARNAADLLASLFVNEEEEKLVVLYLDAGQHMLGLDEHPGLSDEAPLPMRAIFASALGRDAAGMVIAHNHPSGNPEPSRADVAATQHLAQVAAALGVTLHDHLIFASGGACRSFRELGLL